MTSFEDKRQRYVDYFGSVNFYLDIQNDNERRFVERELGKLDGKVETFFTHKVKCVISETGVLTGVVKEKVEEWKIRLISLQQFKVAMVKYFRVNVNTLHQAPPVSTVLNVSKATLPKNDFVEFSFPFVSISDSLGHYRPTYKEYNQEVAASGAGGKEKENTKLNGRKAAFDEQAITRFPFFPMSYLLVSQCGMCPFHHPYETLPFSKTSYKRRTLLENFPATKAKEMKPFYDPLISRDRILTTELQVQKAALIKSLKEKRAHAHTILAKRAASDNFPEFNYNASAKPEKLDIGGFCECCVVKYDNIREHLNCESHFNYSRDPDNYEKIDEAVETLKDRFSFQPVVSLLDIYSVWGERCDECENGPVLSAIPLHWLGNVDFRKKMLENKSPETVNRYEVAFKTYDERAIEWIDEYGLPAKLNQEQVDGEEQHGDHDNAQQETFTVEQEMPHATPNVAKEEPSTADPTPCLDRRLPNNETATAPPVVPPPESEKENAPNSGEIGNVTMTAVRKRRFHMILNSTNSDDNEPKSGAGGFGDSTSPVVLANSRALKRATSQLTLGTPYAATPKAAKSASTTIRITSTLDTLRKTMQSVLEDDSDFSSPPTYIEGLDDDDDDEPVKPIRKRTKLASSKRSGSFIFK